MHDWNNSSYNIQKKGFSMMIKFPKENTSNTATFLFSSKTPLNTVSLASNSYWVDCKIDEFDEVVSAINSAVFTRAELTSGIKIDLPKKNFYSWLLNHAKTLADDLINRAIVAGRNILSFRWKIFIDYQNSLINIAIVPLYDDGKPAPTYTLADIPTC